jgi:uncharacterized membrane protein YeaQ/YmgE (transglycosylase-associated protein family)
MTLRRLNRTAQVLPTRIDRVLTDGWDGAGLTPLPGGIRTTSGLIGKGAEMEVDGIISAIFIGIIIGVLGRLVVPGRQRIGVLWTIAVGIVAALIGSALAAAIGVADTKGVDWIEWVIQIALAAVGVAALDRAKARR